MKRQILDKSKWINLRQNVRNSYDFHPPWNDIIEKFKGRITDFYFGPIEKVKDPGKLKGEGFTILTIQCALIEMFAAFKVGKIHNHRKNNTDPAFEYKYADDCFIPFLHSEKIFENHFFVIDPTGLKVTNQPFNANQFYNKVRCGLMHEARTKGEWVINAKRSYIGNEIIFITNNLATGTVSIDRTILNKQLKNYFEQYLQKLSLENEEGNTLRRLFARKLDHLYDIPRDPNNYDWWEDR